MLSTQPRIIRTEVLDPHQTDPISIEKKLAAARLLQATPEYGSFKPDPEDNPAGIMNNWDGHFIDNRSPSATWVLVYDGAKLIGCLRYLTAQTQREDLQPHEVLEYKRFRDLDTVISQNPQQFIEVNRCAFAKDARGEKLAYYLVKALLESVIPLNLPIFTASRSASIVALVGILLDKETKPNCAFVYETNPQSTVQAISNDHLEFIPLTTTTTTLRDALAYALPTQELPSDINNTKAFSNALNRSIYVIHEDGHSEHINNGLPDEPIFVFAFKDGAFGGVKKRNSEEVLTREMINLFLNSLTCQLYIIKPEQQQAALEKTEQKIKELEKRIFAQPGAANMFPNKDPLKAKLAAASPRTSINSSVNQQQNHR